MAAAPAHVGDVELCRERTRWFPALVSNHVVDLVNRYPPDQLPAEPDRLHPRPRPGTTTTTTPRSARRTPRFVGDEVIDRFCVLGPAEAHVERLRELADAGVDAVQPVPDERRRGRDARRVRPRGDPGARRRHGGRRAMSARGTLIENGTIVNADGSQQADVLVGRRDDRGDRARPAGRAARRGRGARRSTPPTAW